MIVGCSSTRGRAASGCWSASCARWPASAHGYNIIEEQVAAIRAQVGDGRAICGLSGGVDSAVAAALVHRAVGDQLTCVFVDHGLLREGEAEQVEKDYVAATGIKLKVVEAADKFLAALAGVVDPEQKRKIIGREFIRAFESAARELDAERHVEFLVQGTLYPDVVESGAGAGTANIKTHHNVGGLPDDLRFQLVEPLRTLFKDEVRALGVELGLPEPMVWRHPFPGPGLAIRIIGEVTQERLAILRAADRIAREELTAAGLDRDVWQFPVVLLADVRSVGVQGDGRTYGHPVVLRPVSREDAMTADWSRLPYEVIAKISPGSNGAQISRVVWTSPASHPAPSVGWGYPAQDHSLRLLGHLVVVHVLAGMGAIIRLVEAGGRTGWAEGERARIAEAKARAGVAQRRRAGCRQSLLELEGFSVGGAPPPRARPGNALTLRPRGASAPE